MPGTEPRGLGDEKVREIVAAWSVPGASGRSVAAECGVGESTARKYRPKARGHIERVAAVPKEAVREMARSAGRSLRGDPYYPQEIDDLDEPVEAMWEREERRGESAIRKAQLAHKFKWRAPEKNLLLTFVSDMHIAPGTCIDFKQMREDAERIRDTPGCYAILAGDQVDNHIKHQSAILSARSQPSDQYRLFDYYLSILGPKCLVVTSGNHDNWTNEKAGVDVLGRIVRDRRVFYAPDEAWLEIEVGDQQYVVGVRHQYRYNSQFNQTHTVKQWLRLGPREFDIGIIGHHHEAAIEQVIYRDKFRWVARPGSYQITTSYCRQYGFNHAIPTCPTFLLHGDEHDVSGWKSLRAMLRSQQAIRSLGGMQRGA